MTENTRNALDSLSALAEREASDVTSAAKRAVKRARSTGRKVADNRFAAHVAGSADRLADTLQTAADGAASWDADSAHAALLAALA